MSIAHTPLAIRCDCDHGEYGFHDIHHVEGLYTGVRDLEELH
jgi:hypothetical protein